MIEFLQLIFDRHFSDYWTEGSILVDNVASRPQILEAAIHHMQRIKYVGEYVQDVLSKARLEIESQDYLLKIGKKEGAASEMAEIQKAKETWQEFYNTLKGATKSE